MIDNINIVIYSFIFLMPGFIIKSIIDAINPSVKESDFKATLRLLLYSVLNCGICVLLSLAFFSELLPSGLPLWSIVLIVVIALPVVVGLAAGYAKSKDMVRNFLGVLGIRTIHPIPAWDWKFSRTQDAWYIIVTLTDGSSIAGYFGKNSLASHSDVKRDLYIEKIFTIGHNNEWRPSPSEGGILISSDRIQSVEFVKKTV